MIDRLSKFVQKYVEARKVIGNPMSTIELAAFKTMISRQQEVISKILEMGEEISRIEDYQKSVSWPMGSSDFDNIAWDLESIDWEKYLEGAQEEEDEQQNSSG